MVWRHPQGANSRQAGKRWIHAPAHRAADGGGLLPAASSAHSKEPGEGSVSSSDLLDFHYARLSEAGRVVGRVAGEPGLRGAHGLVIHKELSGWNQLPQRRLGEA